MGNIRIYSVVVIILLSLAACGKEKAESTSAESLELAVCGWDEVFIMRFDGLTDSSGEKIWSWRADDSPGLPDSMRARFASTDECKPVDSGRAILITSSSDGVALVDLSSKKALFWASAVNAHSAALLPGGLVAVAASHRPEQPGDRLVLFAPGTPGVELAHYELSHGHGAVWDSERELLYALADDYVRVFRLVGHDTGAAHLEDVGRIELPERGGHDLYPVPGTAYLSLSTGKKCWLLDRDTGQVLPHPELADMARIKSMCVNPRSGQLAWTQAEGENWWTGRIMMRGPENTVLMPEQKIYKVRWVQ
jgi:hypothetical protein